MEPDELVHDCFETKKCTVSNEINLFNETFWGRIVRMHVALRTFCFEG